MSRPDCSSVLFVVAEGLRSSSSARASRCGGCSGCGAQALRLIDARSCGVWTQELRFTGLTAAWRVGSSQIRNR